MEARHSTPTPNALARGLLPTTPSPTLDNPCEAIPEPDIPECKDLPAETPEPTPLPPTPAEQPQILPNVPLEDTDTDTTTDTDTDTTQIQIQIQITDTDTDTESGGDDEASSEN